MGDTAIEWTDKTWNPVTGCDRVSPGCAHCYALDFAAWLKAMGRERYQKDGDEKTSGPGFGLTLHPDLLEKPLRWRKPVRVFVNSMSDVFHEEIPTEFIARMFATMAVARQHVFQVLTKRPDRMHELLNDPAFEEQVFAFAQDLGAGGLLEQSWPLPNVWMGVTIENRKFVGRADQLRATPAAIRFISAEPLLGPVIHTHYSDPDGAPDMFADGSEDAALNLTDIDWLIVGGESGSKHRRFDPGWAADLRDASRESGTAFFVKQMGGTRPGNEMEDLPEELRIREFPRLELSA